MASPHTWQMLLDSSSVASAGMWTTASRPKPGTACRRANAPFKESMTDVMTEVTVIEPNMTMTTNTAQLRFGYSSWSTDCAGAWDATAVYGRLCIVGTKAPFFTAFAYSDGDYCVDSTQYYAQATCSATKQFFSQPLTERFGLFNGARHLPANDF